MAREEVKQEEQYIQAALTVLTVDHVNERLEAIRQVIKEEHPVVASEEAHEEQDKLLRDVLEAIANGAEDPVGLSKAVLEVFNVEFTRWYS